MQNVRIINRLEKTSVAHSLGETTLEHGVNEITALCWLELQKSGLRQNIEAGFILPENKAETDKAIADYRAACWAEFDALGVAAVKVATEPGEKYAAGALKLLATEWLLDLEDSRNSKALRLAEEANSIAAKARSEARMANIIATSAIPLSMATAIAAAWIGLKFK